MSAAAAAVAAARRTAAIFRASDRAVLAVRGGDRVRFLQGQLTNDVEALDAAGPRATCYALLLTRQGRIVADFHVVTRPDAIWLETDAAAAPAAVGRLVNYVVADDVSIADVGELARVAIEGPLAREVAGAALETSLAIAEDGLAECSFGGTSILATAWSLAGGPGVQLFAPRDAADALLARLCEAGGSFGAVEGDREALEVLRIEAGLPRAGAELGTDTLPAELHLVDRAVSFTKGCFTGQEVVTRMHTRGRVGHVLVGIALEAGAPLPPRGTPVERSGARIGAITSAVLSPTAGPIALAIVRVGSEAPGTEVVIAGRGAAVAALPFVPIPGRA